MEALVFSFYEKSCIDLRLSFVCRSLEKSFLSVNKKKNIVRLTLMQYAQYTLNQSTEVLKELKAWL